MADLLKPIEITLLDLDGNELNFNIGRFPALTGLGMIARFIPLAPSAFSGGEKVVQFAVDCLKVVEIVKEDGTTINLKTPQLIDNHIPDGEVLTKLMFKVMDYNSNFFKPGNIYNTLDRFSGVLKPLFQKMLKDWSGTSSKSN